MRRRFNQSILPKFPPERGDRDYDHARKVRKEKCNKKSFDAPKISIPVKKHDVEIKKEAILLYGETITYSDWIDYEWLRWRDICQMSDFKTSSEISKLSEQKIKVIFENHEEIQKRFGNLFKTFEKNFSRE